MFAILVAAYRRAKVLKRPFRLHQFVMSFIMSVVVLYVNHFIISQTFYALDVYQIEMNTSALRYYFWLTILVIILVVGIIAWLFDYRFNRPHQINDYKQCETIIDSYGGNYLSHLLYSGDKDVFMHDNEQAFLMYRYKGNALVVLGDPIGDTQSFQTLLESFYQYAERLGYDVIFYQVSDRFMPLYHNFGNQFFKLGRKLLLI